jgi:predicted RNA-binding protein YlqC (UPF0109 family)
MNATELLELMVKALVDKPVAVAISEIKGEQSSVFEIRVATEDLGKVIGKQGRNAAAIRGIMVAVGKKEKRRFTVEIIE